MRGVIRMAKWYERSVVATLRKCVENELKMPPKIGSKDQTETPAEFWSRVEKAGLLAKALALYDELAAENEAWVHTRRETKKQFAERVEREGRGAEVERERAALLASGMSERDAQEELVDRFQPLDGSATRNWPTPDPWQEGRLFRKKAEQDELLALANDDDEERAEARQAYWRVEYARRRRAERNALEAARRRARTLAAANAARTIPNPASVHSVHGQRTSR
jgi:hypothetical protein